MADATGTSDALTVNLVHTASTATATIDADGVETLNLKVADSNETHVVDLDNNLTSGAKVVVTGDNAAGDVTIAGLEGIRTIDASALKGLLKVDSSARGSAAMTITSGSNADDHIAMENVSDVLDAGTGASDMLEVVYSGSGGGITVDLTSTTDQVSIINGAANASVQKGFEDVDLSGYSQTGLGFGATITGTTGINTSVGTDNGDTITSGTGADVITGGKGADNITLSAGADIDTVKVAAGDTVLTIGGSGAGGTISCRCNHCFCL